MLNAVIKKQWAEMILDNIKGDEYRAMNAYWAPRFRKEVGAEEFLRALTGKPTNKTYKIRYQVGYAKDCTVFVVTFRLRTGYGKVEWGAVEGEKYFIIGIESFEVIRRKKNSNPCRLAENTGGRECLS